MFVVSHPGVIWAALVFRNTISALEELNAVELKTLSTIEDLEIES